MTKRTTAAICILLSFMFCFTCIGYASLTTDLTVEGTVEIEWVPPEAVVITKVEFVDSASTATSNDFERFLPTIVDSTISGSAGQTVTYKITVQNYSPYRYSYVGISCDASVYNNNVYGDGTQNHSGTGLTVTTKNVVTDSAGTFGAGTTIAAKGTVDENGDPLDTLTFYATYTIKSGALSSIHTLLNYEFGVHTDDAGKAAVDGALAQFEYILNDDNMYAQLMQKYDSNVSSGVRGDHVGNVATSLVAGIFTDDDELIINLFEDKLVLGDVEVKTLIKEMNVDGKPGDEMVIFLTPTDIMGMKISNSRTYIPDVYCAVFTNSQYSGGTPSGTWYQLGDLYSGKAYGLRYTTGLSPSSWFNADCINPSTWVSTGDDLETSSDYAYTVAAGKSIDNIIQATNSSVTATLRERVGINSENQWIS